MTDVVVRSKQIDSMKFLSFCLMLIYLNWLIEKEHVRSLLPIVRSTAGPAVIFDA